jgi:hypothetical protein
MCSRTTGATGACAVFAICATVSVSGETGKRGTIRLNRIPDAFRIETTTITVITRSMDANGPFAMVRGRSFAAGL